ncbi:putative metal homeostasis protein [Paenibacillus kribbensis]|nr:MULTISPECIES: putative metal homeostasis protein [Paenibacillus]MEC0238152.1 putative metal homeostasis protein [Paenibacillus kribbensis]
MAKADVAAVRRQLSSPNKVMRRRALRTIKATKRAS